MGTHARAEQRRALSSRGCSRSSKGRSGRAPGITFSFASDHDVGPHAWQPTGIWWTAASIVRLCGRKEGDPRRHQRVEEGDRADEEIVREKAGAGRREGGGADAE